MPLKTVTAVTATFKKQFARIRWTSYCSSPNRKPYAYFPWPFTLVLYAPKSPKSACFPCVILLVPCIITCRADHSHTLC